MRTPTVERVPNPNAAVSGVLLANGPLLLALNHAEENRESLSLASSTDFGNTWRIAHEFEGESSPLQPSGREYSYPWIMQDQAGDVHLLYTWRRSRIKHVHFNPAWLARRR